MTPAEQRLWVAVRILKRNFDAAQAGFAAGVQITDAAPILVRWCEEGFLAVLTQANETLGRLATYRVLKDIGRHAPGSHGAALREIALKAARSRGRDDQAPDMRQRLWTALRDLRNAMGYEFSRAAAASGPVTKKVFSELERAGFVSIDRAGRVTLVRDSGPLAPRRNGDALADPNDGREYPLREARTPSWSVA